MTQNDPTDNALAAIASILDHKDVAEVKTPEADHAAEPVTVEPIHAAEAFHFTETVTVVSETVTVVTETETLVAEHEAPATVPEAIDVDGYTRVGPGPLDAIRFRWTARRDEHGDYFVDETIGASSRPISSGPMPQDEVVAFIDGRERAARERFDALKSSMTLGHPFGNRHAHQDVGEN